MNSPDQTNQPTAPKLNQRQRLLAEQLAAGVPREKAARAAGYTMGAKSADAAISNSPRLREYARKLKDVAMQVDIPVLTASQLNDEGRLRESRAIGMEADVVILIKDDFLVVDKESVAVRCHLQGDKSRFVPTATGLDEDPF